MVKKNSSTIGGNRKRPATGATISNSEMARAKSIFRRYLPFVKGADGKIPTPSDTTLYVAFNASGVAGKVDLITANTKPVVGVTNFDGNKLNTGRNIVIAAARILYTTDGSELVSSDWQNEDRLPAELQNAEIVITQGGKSILSMPLTDLQGDKFQAWRKFSDTPFIKNNEIIKMELQLPEGVTAPIESGTVKSNIRFELRVLQTQV